MIDTKISLGVRDVRGNGAARPAGHGPNAVDADERLLERDAQCERLAAAVAAARQGSGGLTLIEGAAGLGKSSLLGWAAVRAREGGMVALTARGAEPEREFSFGVVLQLLERRLVAATPAEREELMSGPASLTLALFDAGRWGVGQPPDHLGHDGLLHGLFWLTANMAERAPLLLAVDDLHWCDEASLRFLRYLLPRLADVPIALIAARRPAAGGRLPDELAGDPLADRVSLAPLTPAGIVQLLEGSLARPVAPRFAAACHHVTAGNPFLARAIVRTLREDGIEPSDESAGLLSRLRPEEIGRQALAQVSRLGDDAIALSAAAAVLGDDSRLAHVAALAELGLDAAADAADVLVAAEILARPEPASFAHPLLRAAVYEGIRPARRGRLHVRAARLLHADHAPAEAVAAQLLAGPAVGDRWAAAVLLAAADRALMTGSPDPAIHCLTRALAEPLERSDRAGVLVLLAQSKAMIGAPGAEEDLAQAMPLIDDPVVRARAHQALGTVLYTRGDLPSAAAEFAGALEVVGDRDDPLARELHAAYFSAASLVPELASSALAHISPLLEREAGGETPAERGALAAAAAHLATSGGPRERTIALARRAWGDGRLLEDSGPDGWAWSLVTGALTWSDEPREGGSICGQVIEEAGRRGSLMAYATASFCAVQPAHALGRLAAARAHAEAALDARRYGWSTYPAALAAWYSILLVDQDELEAAERPLQVLDDAGCGTPAGRAAALTARGRLRLIQGRAREALDDLLAAGEAFRPIAGPDDTFAPWRTYAAVAAHRLGEADRAGELVLAAERIADATGTPSRRVEALRARAQIEPAGGVELLTLALGSLEGSESCTEQIRCRAELGAALRRQGHRTEARRLLSEAREQAHAIGARRIERLALAELRIAGARPRRLAFSGVAALTASERRVAELAAGGAGNREIAQALFVTPRTVEQHLYNAYKKLGIGSRSQLAAALRG